MKRRGPAFQFYAQDFLVGTVMMSTAEVGAFVRLLCHQWVNESLPDDDTALARLALIEGESGEHVAAILRRVRAKFQPDKDGQLRNRRLEAIRLEQASYRARKARAGKLGAGRRWGKKRGANSAMAVPSVCHKQKDDPSSSPSPSSSKKGDASPKPAFVEIKELEAALAIHPANWEWIGYKSDDATPELKADLAAKRKRLAHLKCGGRP
ncbi:MAG TPA: DUF1376 domain-containing protein [Candidatus Limnocylindria bacterium]|jgi:uncharacterized protein YdaU (DUF1376 family)|nr:DUF1376 domain-containing protein [Candidatus Limnocylindria bacterium]